MTAAFVFEPAAKGDSLSGEPMNIEHRTSNIEHRMASFVIYFAARRSLFAIRGSFSP